MLLSKTLTFYKQTKIQEQLVEQAKNKEVAFKFSTFFGKRPEVLRYPSDVLELAKQKITSFHCSEELWKNPLRISTELKKQEIEDLRKGWDLILDIDCKFFSYSQAAAYYTIKALKQNGVKSITAKYSGNKGFHIAIPWEAFPQTLDGKPVKDMFPEAPRRIANYITHLIKPALTKAIMKLEKNNFPAIIEKTGLKPEEITQYATNEFGDKIPTLNIDPFLEIDTLLISTRHLYRMPYSFHEKSELVSVPINIDEVLKFNKEQAKPENVNTKNTFLDRTTKYPDAEKLLINSLDFFIPQTEEEKTSKEKDYELPEKAIGEEYFPPCIINTFKGLEDGRKRSVFAIIKFLRGCGWDFDQIEEKLKEWNEKNHEPLRQQVITGQIKYAKQTKRIVPPPNCSNPNYYKGIRTCTPDTFCAKIKNPLQYARIKATKIKPKVVKK